MKKVLILLLVTAGASFGAAWFVSQQQNRSALEQQRAELEAKWAQERERLAAASAVRPRSERSPGTSAPTIVEVMVPQGERKTPSQLIESLRLLRVGATAKNQTIRKVVYHLESLAQEGSNAVPAIRAFLARNEDVDYTGEPRERGEDRGEGRDDRRNAFRGFRTREASTDFVLPPSLRIGLFEVLRQIGGGASEEALAETLATTGRAVEVAYLAKILEELTPSKHREIAVTAAKDLLLNPLPMQNPNRLDENGKAYLYGVLAMYGDRTFAETAKGLLVDGEGKIDRNALEYMTATLKEASVPSLIQAMKDVRLTNQWDKASIASSALNFVGKNAQADELLNEIVTDPKLDARLKAMTITRLAGGDFGPMSSESPKDPAVIQQRLNVLEAIRPDVKDDVVGRMIDATQENLRRLQAGEAPTNPWDALRTARRDAPATPSADGTTPQRQPRGEGGRGEGGRGRNRTPAPAVAN